MKRWNQSGFTLIEMSIGMAVGLIVCAMLIEILLMSLESDRGFKAFTEFQETTSWTQAILFDSNSCTQNLNLIGFAPPAVSSADIELPDGLKLAGDTAPVVQKGLSRGGLNYTNLVLKRLAPLSTGRYAAELTVTAVPQVPLRFGAGEFSRRYLFVVETNEAGVIQSCSMAPDQVKAAAEACAQLGGTVRLDGTCSLPSCPPNQYLQAILTGGKLQCAQIGIEYDSQFKAALGALIGSCTQGLAFAGVDSTGRVICR